jgi:hypothetical protein
MIEEGDVPDKSKVEHDHLERVKEHIHDEEEAEKAAHVIKGADTKSYKKFKEGQYVPPPKKELSDQMKLKLARRNQILTGFMGLAGLGITFIIIYNSPLNFSILENFVIIFKVYNSTLNLSILENYFVIEINLILLGCALVVMNTMGLIGFQHQHDRISDRISSGQSMRSGGKEATRKYYGLIMFIGAAGVGIIFLGTYYSTQHISIFEKFVIFLSIYDSTLHLSIFDSLAIKMNLILLGCALAATSIGVIAFRHKHSKISS